MQDGIKNTPCKTYLRLRGSQYFFVAFNHPSKYFFVESSDPEPVSAVTDVVVANSVYVPPLDMRFRSSTPLARSGPILVRSPGLVPGSLPLRSPHWLITQNKHW